MTKVSGARRIDKWLWCVRRFKTRTIAARFVAENAVRVTRDCATQRVDRPAFQLCEGDEVSFLLGERLVVLTVAGFAERRVAPEAAKRLYLEQSGNAALDVAPGPSCKASRYR